MTKLYPANHSFIKQNYPVIYEVFGTAVKDRRTENPMLKGIKQTNPELYKKLTNNR